VLDQKIDPGFRSRQAGGEGPIHKGAIQGIVNRLGRNGAKGGEVETSDDIGREKSFQKTGERSSSAQSGLEKFIVKGNVAHWVRTPFRDSPDRSGPLRDYDKKQTERWPRANKGLP
jgi:hypothetical protein